jgi:hypothetical protein
LLAEDTRNLKETGIQGLSVSQGWLQKYLNEMTTVSDGKQVLHTGFLMHMEKRACVSNLSEPYIWMLIIATPIQIEGTAAVRHISKYGIKLPLSYCSITANHVFLHTFPE